MHIFITGGAGFIGSNLAQYHLNKNDSVHVVDDLSTGSITNLDSCFLHHNFSFTRANLLVWKGLKAAVETADRVYHLAAIVGIKKVLEDPRAVMEVNVTATERLFKIVSEANATTKILLASSSEVYGFNQNKSFSEADDIVLRAGGRSHWCDAVSKLADEYLAYSFVKSSNLNVSIVRLFNTIGQHQTSQIGAVVPTFIKQAVQNIPLAIFGDGTQTRSFCDVRDTILAFDLLLSGDSANGEIINVGNDHEISITDLAELVIARARSTSTLRYTTYAQAYGTHFEDITHSRPILDRLKTLTNFKPYWTLSQTIDELIGKEKRDLKDNPIAFLKDKQQTQLIRL